MMVYKDPLANVPVYGRLPTPSLHQCTTTQISDAPPNRGFPTPPQARPISTSQQLEAMKRFSIRTDPPAATRQPHHPTVESRSINNSVARGPPNPGPNEQRRPPVVGKAAQVVMVLNRLGPSLNTVPETQPYPQPTPLHRSRSSRSFSSPHPLPHSSLPSVSPTSSPGPSYPAMTSASSYDNRIHEHHIHHCVCPDPSAHHRPHYGSDTSSYDSRYDVPIPRQIVTSASTRTLPVAAPPKETIRFVGRGGAGSKHRKTTSNNNLKVVTSRASGTSSFSSGRTADSVKSWVSQPQSPSEESRVRQAFKLKGLVKWSRRRPGTADPTPGTTDQPGTKPAASVTGYPSRGPPDDDSEQIQILLSSPMSTVFPTFKDPRSDTSSLSSLTESDSLSVSSNDFTPHLPPTKGSGGGLSKITQFMGDAPPHEATRHLGGGLRDESSQRPTLPKLSTGLSDPRQQTTADLYSGESVTPTSQHRQNPNRRDTYVSDVSTIVFSPPTPIDTRSRPTPSPTQSVVTSHSNPRSLYSQLEEEDGEDDPLLTSEENSPSTPSTPSAIIKFDTQLSLGVTANAPTDSDQGDVGDLAAPPPVREDHINAFDSTRNTSRPLPLPPHDQSKPTPPHSTSASSSGHQYDEHLDAPAPSCIIRPETPFGDYLVHDAHHRRRNSITVPHHRVDSPSGYLGEDQDVIVVARSTADASGNGWTGEWNDDMNNVIRALRLL